MANSTKISNTSIIESGDQGFQGFVRQDLMVATTTTGSPAAGTFYSSITNRASIQDLSKNLRVQLGVERTPTQSVMQIQNEFGPNGEPVWAALNDDKGLIRFVGSGWSNVTGNSGNYILNANPTDYVEVTFYGTGLNLLAAFGGTTYSYAVAIDGSVSESTVFNTATNSALVSRNYSSNQIVNLASGLSLGVHTVKVRAPSAATGNFNCYGFEILNESTTLKVTPGTSYLSGKKNVLSSLQSLAYNSTYDLITRDGATQVSTSTRGGRVLVYQKSDGTIGKSIIETNSSSANLTLANHINEEVVRTYHFREFGAGRSDDFSLVAGTAGNKAFTLDDGTTTLVGNNVGAFADSGGVDGVFLNAAASFITITFVGTGLDVTQTRTAALDGTVTVSVDGTAITTGTATGSVFGISNKVTKIVSGLPYGTHTVKILMATFGSTSPAFGKFIVYGPKKPSIPAGAIELADYNVMANWSIASGGLETVSSGVLRKQLSQREAVFVGAGWTINTINPSVYVGGWQAFTTGSGQSMSFTFFGTGLELRGRGDTTLSGNNLITISGNGRATPNSGAGLTINNFGGWLFSVTTPMQFSQAGSNVSGSGLSITGLSLGLYTVTVTNNSGTAMDIEAIDIITPIHSHKSNIYADIQNTLPVGSCGISDNRKLTPNKDVKVTEKAWAQATGIQGSVTTSISTPTPINDMSVVIKTNGGALDIMYAIAAQTNTTGTATFLQIYVDGSPVGFANEIDETLPGSETNAVDRIIVPVAAGVHKVDVYFNNGGSGIAQSNGNKRHLIVREL